MAFILNETAATANRCRQFSISLELKTFSVEHDVLRWDILLAFVTSIILANHFTVRCRTLRPVNPVADTRMSGALGFIGSQRPLPNLAGSLQEDPAVVARLQQIELEVLLIAEECKACGKFRLRGEPICEMPALK